MKKKSHKSRKGGGEKQGGGGGAQAAVAEKLDKTKRSQMSLIAEAQKITSTTSGDNSREQRKIQKIQEMFNSLAAQEEKKKQRMEKKKQREDQKEAFNELKEAIARKAGDPDFAGFSLSHSHSHQPRYDARGHDVGIEEPRSSQIIEILDSDEENED